MEAALGTIDFLSEDVWLNDAAIDAYYRLLNCGFRLGWAAGTDFPCNDSQPLGSLLTYVRIRDTLLTYQKWIDGIKNGRTVVSTNGHKEFIEMRVNGRYEPGDEIKINEKGLLEINVKWTGIEKLSGRVELVCNGKVIASKEGAVENGKPFLLRSGIDVTRSSWICARRMDEKGHQLHTSPVYITVNDQPVRANSDDPEYFINWIDNILKNISPGAKWNYLFKENLQGAQERYMRAKNVYEKILREAKSQN